MHDVNIVQNCNVRKINEWRINHVRTQQIVIAKSYFLTTIAERESILRDRYNRETRY